jgi:hypothetical protein
VSLYPRLWEPDNAEATFLLTFNLQAAHQLPSMAALWVEIRTAIHRHLPVRFVVADINNEGSSIS